MRRPRILNENRKRAILKYYEQPNRCLFCKKIIHIAEHQQPWMTRRKKFCNKSCHNSYYNPKRLKETSMCASCGKEFMRYKTKSGVWSCSKNCVDCQKLGYGKSIPYAFKTKGEIYRQSSSNNIAKNSICANARLRYRYSDKSWKCLICGYDKLLDVAHIKAVSEFTDDTPIYVINDPDTNLVCLCSNHHREFDNNIMDDDHINEIYCSIGFRISINKEP